MPINPELNKELFDAVRTENLSEVDSLLQRNADPNARISENAVYKTVLHEAVYRENASIVKLLLNTGADPDKSSTDEQYTPLHVAALSGSEECVKLLLKAKANPKITDSNDETPLYYASFKVQKTEIGKQLIDATLSRNPKENKPEFLDSNQELSSAWDACKEIKQMAEKIPDSSYSVYDLYKAKDHQLEKICRHEAIKKFQLQNLEEEYPDFAPQLRTQLKEGFDRKTAVDKTVGYMTMSENRQNRARRLVLNKDCLRKIFEYIPSEELKKLSIPPQNTQNQQKNLSLQSAKQEKNEISVQSIKSIQVPLATAACGGARPKQPFQSKQQIKKNLFVLEKKEKIAAAIDLLKQENVSDAQFKAAVDNIATSSSVMQSSGYSSSSSLYPFNQREDELNHKDPSKSLKEQQRSTR